MGSDFWIYAVVFVAVFVLTSLILTRRERNKSNRESSERYIEVEAEVLERPSLPSAQLAGDGEQGVSPYQVLGVHENDSMEVIRDVYDKLSEIYHPGKYLDADELSREQKMKRFEQIRDAYARILRTRKKNQ